MFYFLSISCFLDLLSLPIQVTAGTHVSLDVLGFNLNSRRHGNGLGMTWWFTALPSTCPQRYLDYQNLSIRNG